VVDPSPDDSRFLDIQLPNWKEFLKLNEQTELLREMCHLLRVIAEPQLAKRDEKLRASLLEAVCTTSGRFLAEVGTIQPT